MKLVGIDISKAVFDAVILENEHYQHQQFHNNQAGFQAFFKWLKPNKSEALFCLEATGIYGLSLANFLYAKEQKVLIVNPIKTHAFSKMEMSRNKTDKSDAHIIARYCKHLWDEGEIENSLYRPKDKDYEYIQFLMTRLEQLDKMRTQERNHLDSAIGKAVLRSVKQTLKVINHQINTIKEEIASIVKHNETLKSHVTLLSSINGIADKTAWSILAYIGDINFFSCAKQISSYAGLNPRLEQSGTSLYRSKLSKMGSKRLRKALYMPALVAIRHNPILRDLYHRLLAKGKAKKVAVIAVMRKLLVLAYGVLKSGKPFDVNYAK